MTPDRLRRYEELIMHLKAQAGGWHALPRDVAAWWRARDALRCETDEDGHAVISGRGADRASLAYLRVVGDEIAYDVT